MPKKQVLAKILVPVDGSAPSIAGEEVAAMIAKSFNSKITALHAVTHELMHPSFQRFAPETPEFVAGGPRPQAVPWVHVHAPGIDKTTAELTSLYRNEGADYLADAALLFKEEGVKSESKLIEHVSAAEAILNEAKKGDYDLIILGQSGEKEKEAHLGSVAEKVSRQSPVPVLIARGKTTMSKMLVALDGSKTSEKALKCAATLAKKLGSGITLLHVQEAHLFNFRPELTKTIGKSILSSAAKKLKGLKFDQKLESGDPAKIITQTAEKGNYDLIVIGVRGRSSIGRLLLGDVANHVVHYANRSVIIVK